MILISKHFWYIQQEKRAVWDGTRLVTHDLRTYYTLYFLCTITSVHYQGKAAKADAIGAHWIESGAVDTIGEQQLKRMQLGKQQLKQLQTGSSS